MVSIVKRSLSSLVAVSFSWSWFLVLRWCFRIRLVFMVYPGSRKYIRKIAFEWVHRFVPIPAITPIGLIFRPPMIGLYATTKDLLAEVDHHRLKKVTEKIPSAFPYAGSVSLAGAWPSWLNKAGISATKSPLVDATLGTVYAMDKVCREMIRKRGLETRDAVLAIIGGGGFVGRVLVPKICSAYKSVMVVDSCYLRREENQNIVCTGEPDGIAAADAVLVLTPRGDDAAKYVPLARAGQVWGDDTFPDMTPPTQEKFKSAGVDLYKTAMVDGALKFVPPLPTFGINHVPGCLISAIINEIEPNIRDMEHFYQVADANGFRARLFSHRKDLK